MTNEQKCIVKMYKLLEEIEKNARKGNLSLLRSSRISGADMFQGCPPISRILHSITEEFEEVLYNSFKEIEIEQLG